MAKPTNKTTLLDLASANFDKLLTFIDGLSDEIRNQNFPEGTLNRNIRDVLAHLYHWHLLMLDWYKVGMNGDKPEIPAPGYTWKTTPELNQWINSKYSATPLKEVRENFEVTHLKMIEIISSHSDEELFTKKRYKWTGTTSLGAYFISATSSHYDWALKLIKKATK